MDFWGGAPYLGGVEKRATMKLFLYFVALLTGVVGAQGAEASSRSQIAVASAQAIVGAKALQQASEQQHMTRPPLASMPARSATAAHPKISAAPGSEAGYRLSDRRRE